MPNNNLDGSRNSPNTLRSVILLPLYVIGYCAASFVLPVDVRHGYGGQVGGFLLLLMLAIIFRLFKKYALTSQQRTAELSELDRELQERSDLELRLKQLTVNSSGYRN